MTKRLLDLVICCGSKTTLAFGAAEEAGAAGAAEAAVFWILAVAERILISANFEEPRSGISFAIVGWPSSFMKTPSASEVECLTAWAAKLRLDSKVPTSLLEFTILVLLGSQ